MPNTDTFVPSQYLEHLIKPILPAGKTFLVWLSHDVDRLKKTFFHYLYYAWKERRASHLGQLIRGENPYWNFEALTALEEKYKVRSTFFFLNESIEANIFEPRTLVLAKRYHILDAKIQDVIRTLDKGGWEVGVHGSYRSYNDKNLLGHEKETLEKIVGHAVVGGRQHYLNLTIPQTWEIHRALGFRYDASFGLTTDVGYREGIVYPFRPFGDAFTVFPLTIMDKVLLGKYKPAEAWDQCLRLMDTAQKKGGLFSLLWHDRVFNEHDFPGYAQTYERLIVECQKRSAQFCTGQNVFEFLKA